MSGGATGAVETLASCLADAGDAFLIPSPYYPGYDRDFCWRTGARLLPIPSSSSNNFQITSSALQSTYDAALNSNIPVKGILVSNPSNPLGTTMSKSSLQTLLLFTSSRHLHLICDEIYAGTIFGTPRFVGVSELLLSHPSADPNLIHIVSSLSKNLGLPGFRVGLIYSYNDSVVACARTMSSFSLVSTPTQHLLAPMLADDVFSAGYAAENARRLRERRELFVAGLRRVGIGFVEGNAGLFCWMDLRRFMKKGGMEGELELWRVILREVKLNVSPGSSFHCGEAGWFRACFSNMDEETVEVALRRIKMFVDRETEEDEERKRRGKKMRYPDGGMRLSLPGRYEESAAISPQSPLVHANS